MHKSSINGGFTITALDCNVFSTGQTAQSMGSLKESISRTVEKTIAFFKVKGDLLLSGSFNMLGQKNISSKGLNMSKYQCMYRVFNG